MSILIYGGLNEIGSKLTSFFLEEGIETWVIKSSYRNEKEEEEEMFYGRNALFKPIEANQRWGLDRDCSTACFALNPQHTELTKNEVLGNFERLLEGDQMIQTIVLTVYGGCLGPTEESIKWGEKPALYKELEEAFIKKVKEVNNEKEHIRLIIIRISEQIALKGSSSYPHKQNTHAHSLAACIYQEIQMKRNPGIYFYEIQPKKAEQSLSKISKEEAPLILVKIED